MEKSKVLAKVFGVSSRLCGIIGASIAICFTTISALVMLIPVCIWLLGMWLWCGDLTYEQKQKYRGDPFAYPFEIVMEFCDAVFLWPSRKLEKLEDKFKYYVCSKNLNNA